MGGVVGRARRRATEATRRSAAAAGVAGVRPDVGVRGAAQRWTRHARVAAGAGPAAPRSCRPAGASAAGAPQPAAAVAVVVADVTGGEVARAAEGGDEVDGDVVLAPTCRPRGRTRPPDSPPPRPRRAPPALRTHRRRSPRRAQSRAGRGSAAPTSPTSCRRRRCPRSRRRFGRALLLRLLLLRLLRAGSRRAAEFVERALWSAPPSSPRATRGRGRGGGGRRRPSTPPDASRRPTAAAPAPTAGRRRAHLVERHALVLGALGEVFLRVLLPRDEAGRDLRRLVARRDAAAAQRVERRLHEVEIDAPENVAVRQEPLALEEEARAREGAEVDSGGGRIAVVDLGDRRRQHKRRRTGHLAGLIGERRRQPRRSPHISRQPHATSDPNSKQTQYGILSV